MKRPHLSVEWLLSRGPADEPKEVTELRDQFLAACRTREWAKAHGLSATLATASAFPNMSGTIEMARAEIHLLLGKPDDAIAVAQKYLQPFKSARGRTFDSYAEFYKFAAALPEEKWNDAEAKDDRERVTVWRYERNAALELVVAALRMKGDVVGAHKVREAIRADSDVQPPLEPPKGFYYADRASQDEPLRAAVQDVERLKALAKGGYKAEDLEYYDATSQVRLVAVFANMTLGHMQSANGDRDGARAAFTEAKRLMEQRETIVNREMLQWLIVRERLSR